jgi:polysaccharide biosynthesis protein VpsM
MMKKSLNNTLSLAGLLLAAAPLVHGAPLLSLGDQADLYVTAQAGLQYESNLFLLADNEESDYFVNFTPGLEFRLGRPGSTPFSAVASYQHQFRKFFDFDELDDEYPTARVRVSYDEGALKFSSSASYLETASNTQDASLNGDLVKSERTNWSTLASYRVSPKTSFSTGFEYSILDYERVSFTDSESYSIPANFYYAVTPKTDVSFGYRYREVSADDKPGVVGTDFTDHFFNIGARNEILPKLTGNIQVGYQTREADLDGVEDEDGISIQSSLRYEITPKLAGRLVLNRDFDVGAATSRTVTRNTARVGVDFAVSPLMTIRSDIGYLLADYAGIDREDETFTFDVSANYRPNDMLSVSARYGYRDNQSDGQNSATSYENHIFSVSASLRY